MGKELSFYSVNRKFRTYRLGGLFSHLQMLLAEAIHRFRKPYNTLAPASSPIITNPCSADKLT